MFIDIHTHRASGRANCLEIQNFHSDFERAASGLPCSIGLHPWYLEDHAHLVAELRKFAVRPNVLAIGECGLDKVCVTDMALQKTIFNQQIILARELGKPLIIHCVRAFGELTGIMDAGQPGAPAIIHGFNKKSSLASGLLARGYYISFGAAILNNKFPAADILRTMPENRFFLETDDSGIAISDIYIRASAIRNVGVDVLVQQVAHNFKTVFNRS